MLACQIPYDLRIAELASRFVSEGRVITRDETVAAWQLRWSTTLAGQPGWWTASLIPNLAAWLDRKHGTLTHPLAQFLTGHGTFMTYLVRIRKTASPTCIMCNSGLPDDVQHTFEVCEGFAAHRAALLQRTALPPPVTSRKLVDLMLRDNDGWSSVGSYVGGIISVKNSRVDKYIRDLAAEPEEPSSSPGDSSSIGTDTD